MARRRGVGSNQYRTKAVSGVDAVQIDLAHHLDTMAVGELIRLAQDPKCVPAVLYRLSQHPGPRVRLGVARNAQVPPELLDILAHDSDVEVQGHALAHRSCPVGTLRWAAHHNSEFIRYRVAQHANCPPEVLEHLAADSWQIRRAVARNLRCPVNALAQLAGDADPEVSQTAIANPNLPEEYRALGRVVQ